MRQRRQLEVERRDERVVPGQVPCGEERGGGKNGEADTGGYEAATGRRVDGDPARASVVEPRKRRRSSSVQRA